MLAFRVIHIAAAAFSCLLVGSLQIALARAFTVALPSYRYAKSSPLGRSLGLLHESFGDNDKEGPFDFIFNPVKTNIPKEIQQEIYQAEANTQAAKDRNKRVAIYIAMAVIGVTGAFYNGFLTELRSSSAPDEIPFVLEESAFAWVLGSWLTKFLFMNKIGGALLLLSGAGSGLLAEAEMDTRRTNAEKIWEEMQRRRGAAETKRQKKAAPAQNRKKRQSGKKDKRLDALAELIDDETIAEAEVSSSTELESASPSPTDPDQKSEGVFGAVKEFYKKADAMAASQALLLNKELEDRGVIEKITDETGLKVVGKDEAKKLQSGKEDND